MPHSNAELQQRIDELEQRLRALPALLDRIDALENRRLTVADLPVAALIRKLENVGVVPIR